MPLEQPRVQLQDSAQAAPMEAAWAPKLASVGKGVLIRRVRTPAAEAPSFETPWGLFRNKSLAIRSFEALMLLE